MTGGDYTLWIIALVFLLIVAFAVYAFLSIAMENQVTRNHFAAIAWWTAAFYLGVMVGVLSPTYYLITRY